MATSYFSLPSFARARKHTEELAKTNPKSPVLNDDDEKFLERITSNGERSSTEVTQTQITDNGQTQEKIAKTSDVQVIFPGSESVDDPPESVPDDIEEQVPTLPPRPSSKKSDLNELPSQEEAEAVTKGFATGTESALKDEKRTWSSYIPSVPSISRATSPKDKDKDDRTWAEYASSIVPANIQSISLPAAWTKSKDAKSEPVLNEDGSINEAATKEKEEKEVSVLLDNLNLSSINNRVFAFSEESQKLYERFVQALKDTMNGVPTAYEDMEKIMKEAGPTIEKQWKAMPPFVQVLVKSLPAKLSATVAPELLAAVSEKPGNDAKMMQAANDKAEGSKSKSVKKKRQLLPSFKGLVKKKGLAATLLSNITTFLKTRFPFLMSATNVAMSLSVFILMFVFYYCWKRGREVRLAKETETGEDDNEDDEDDLEVEMTDEDSSEDITKDSKPETLEARLDNTKDNILDANKA